LIFLGNLIFRLMHNIIFSCLRPRQRVYLAYFAMMISMVMGVFPFYIIHTNSLAFVFFAYACGGVAVGTFESNLVSCITPLGHETKKWAIMGMPLGYNGSSIGAFLLFLAAPSSALLEEAVFCFVFVANACGAVYFHTQIPDVPFEASSDTALKFIRSLKRCCDWAPKMWQKSVAVFFNMFSVILMSSIVLYIFSVNDVPIIPGSQHTLPKDAFQAIYNFCGFSGDFLSRRFAYSPKYILKGRSPFIPLILTAIGVAFGVTKIAFLGWIGMFFVMFANGSIYGITTKHVDTTIPRQYNLVALSVWLFVGDMGSYIASNLTNLITVHVGAVPTAAPG